VSRKETTSTSLSDLLRQDGVRQLIEQIAIHDAVLPYEVGPPPPPAPWHARFRGWVHWKIIATRQAIGFWIAGYDPERDE
jgi:hypothetical protein